MQHARLVLPPGRFPAAMRNPTTLRSAWGINCSHCEPRSLFLFKPRLWNPPLSPVHAPAACRGCPGRCQDGSAGRQWLVAASN